MMPLAGLDATGSFPVCKILITNGVRTWLDALPIPLLLGAPRGRRGLGLFRLLLVVEEHGLELLVEERQGEEYQPEADEDDNLAHGLHRPHVGDDELAYNEDRK